MPGATYALVEDVPASWDTYLERVEALDGRVPDGLLVHVAGPTDEGFRIIEIWESQAARERFRDELPTGELDRSVRVQHVHTIFRDLMVKNLFLA
ncbi:MAG: hypothetical protein ACXWZ1_07245 [Gaiellaceae bacterium]